jgi:large subunit ribosomal protein L15
MFQLNNLKPAPGARKNRRRIGRGQGSGRGTTAGRGSKGQLSRSGGPQGPWFEGGQMQIYRRLPKKGFHPRNRVPYQVVNVSMFDRFDASREITPEYLAEKGLVSGRNPRVKILGNGELSGAFTVKVHAVSESAKRKLEEKGGSVELLPWSPTEGRVAAQGGAGKESE